MESNWHLVPSPCSKHSSRSPHNLQQPQEGMATQILSHRNYKTLISRPLPRRCQPEKLFLNILMETTLSRVSFSLPRFEHIQIWASFLVIIFLSRQLQLQFVFLKLISLLIHLLPFLVAKENVRFDQ